MAIAVGICAIFSIAKFKQYRRNRKHLLLVTETAEQSADDDIPYPRHDDPNDEQPVCSK